MPSRNSPTTRVADLCAKYATKSATSVTVSFPAEITVRKPTRGPSDTRISPIDPEWASVATGPPTNSGWRLPIQGEGNPGVAIPMQLGPSIGMPAAAILALIWALTSGPTSPASFPRPGVMIAFTPSTLRTSSTEASIRPWPTPMTTSSGTVGHSPMLG